MEIAIAPTWKQHLAYELLKDNVTESLVYGGAAGGGKSWLGCEWLLLLCIRCPGIACFVGRSELKQMRRSIIPTLNKVCRYYKIDPKKYFKYNGQDNTFIFLNGSRIDLIELKLYPSDPYYERFGSFEYTVGWVEEAGEIDADAVSMIASRTGRCMNDHYGLMGKVLITCNPKKNWIYYDFYIPHRDGKLPEGKAFIPANVEDNTYGEKGYKKKLDSLTGIQRQRLRYGIWEYDNDATALIETDAINSCFRTRSGISFNEDARRRLTVDVARFGSDSSVIGVWEDFHVKLYRFEKLSTTALAKKIRKFAELFGHDEPGPDGKPVRIPIPSHKIIVDGDGVGGGVVDMLECRQFINGSSALPAPVNPAIDEDTGEAIPEQYENLKAQCWFRTAEKINNGVITIEIMADYAELESSEEQERSRIIEDMEQVKIKDMDADGKKGVVSKKDIRKAIRRSTDYFDAIAMHELFILEPEQSIWIF